MVLVPFTSSALLLSSSSIPSKSPPSSSSLSFTSLTAVSCTKVWNTSRISALPSLCAPALRMNRLLSLDAQRCVCAQKGGGEEERRDGRRRERVGAVVGAGWSHGWSHGWSPLTATTVISVGVLYGVPSYTMPFRSSSTWAHGGHGPG